MTDEVLQELWAIKDTIAKEHCYDIDALAEYFLQKQSTRRGSRHGNEADLKTKQGTLADARTACG